MEDFQLLLCWPLNLEPNIQQLVGLWEALTCLMWTFASPWVQSFFEGCFLLNLLIESHLCNCWVAASGLILWRLGGGCVIATVNTKSTCPVSRNCFTNSVFEKPSQEAWPRASDSLGWCNNNWNAAAAFDLVKGCRRAEWWLAVSKEDSPEWAWWSSRFPAVV